MRLPNLPRPRQFGWSLTTTEWPACDVPRLPTQMCPTRRDGYRYEDSRSTCHQSESWQSLESFADEMIGLKESVELGLSFDRRNVCVFEAIEEAFDFFCELKPNQLEFLSLYLRRLLIRRDRKRMNVGAKAVDHIS